MTRTRRCKTRGRPLVRLRCPLSALFFLTFLLALDGTGVLRISLLCALLHEMGHLLAYWLLYRRAPEVEVSPLGLCLRLRGILLPPDHKLLLAAAGPLANLLCCCVALLWMQGTEHFSYTGYWFASANLLIGAGNLLPLPGLDGAHILAALTELLRELHFIRR